MGKVVGLIHRSTNAPHRFKTTESEAVTVDEQLLPNQIARLGATVQLKIRKSRVEVRLFGNQTITSVTFKEGYQRE